MVHPRPFHCHVPKHLKYTSTPSKCIMLNPWQICRIPSLWRRTKELRGGIVSTKGHQKKRKPGRRKFDSEKHKTLLNKMNMRHLKDQADILELFTDIFVIFIRSSSLRTYGDLHIQPEVIAMWFHVAWSLEAKTCELDGPCRDRFPDVASGYSPHQKNVGKTLQGATDDNRLSSLIC